MYNTLVGLSYYIMALSSLVVYNVVLGLEGVVSTATQRKPAPYPIKEIDKEALPDLLFSRGKMPWRHSRPVSAGNRM